MLSFFVNICISRINTRLPVKTKISFIAILSVLTDKNEEIFLSDIHSFLYSSIDTI